MLCKMRLGNSGPEFQFMDQEWLPLNKFEEDKGVLPCMLKAHPISNPTSNATDNSESN